MRLPLPANSYFQTESFDYGCRTGVCLSVGEGAKRRRTAVAICNGPNRKASAQELALMGEQLVQRFWRYRGAA